MSLSSKIDDALKFAAGKGLWDGLLGDSNRWLVVGGLAAALRFVRKGSKAKTLSERLEVGQVITIEHLPASARRRRSRK